MSLAVRTTSAADVDLIAHATYLGEQSLDADERFLLAAEQSFELLAASPHIGGIYETSNPNLQGVRIWQIKGFEKLLIFYRPGADQIEVIRVLHGARDIAAILGEE